jgi:hypothetical protein
VCIYVSEYVFMPVSVFISASAYSYQRLGIYASESVFVSERFIYISEHVFMHVRMYLYNSVIISMSMYLCQ